MAKKEQMIHACRVCSAPGVVYLCDTYNEHSKTTVLSHYRCTECGSVFVGNDVDNEELEVAYSTLDAEQYYEEIESGTRKKMATAIDRLKDLVPHDAAVIDVGTGNGLFVELLREAGYGDVSAHEIRGADLSRIHEIARHIYQDHDYSSIPSDTFDAVTLLDVVEHVIDPGHLMRTCSRILKSDGVVYFHTPVVTRIDRLMHLVQKIPVGKKVGTIWQRGRTSIFHLENYTPKSLALLLEEAGFKDVRIEVENETSWPVARYVRVYLLEKQGLPGFIAPVLVPFVYPLLATEALNANKAIGSARKATRGV